MLSNFGLFASIVQRKYKGYRIEGENINRLIGLLIILVVAYSLFVGSGVNSTVAALIVMAGLFGTLKVVAKL